MAPAISVTKTRLSTRTNAIATPRLNALLDNLALYLKEFQQAAVSKPWGQVFILHTRSESVKNEDLTLFFSELHISSYLNSGKEKGRVIRNPAFQ